MYEYCHVCLHSENPMIPGSGAESALEAGPGCTIRATVVSLPRRGAALGIHLGDWL